MIFLINENLTHQNFILGDYSPTEINSTHNGRRLSLSSNSTGTKNGNGNLLSQLTKSTIVSIFVIVLLSFLFCSSLYLVFRIDSLQKQVINFSRYRKERGQYISVNLIMSMILHAIILHSIGRISRAAYFTKQRYWWNFTNTSLE